MVVSADPKACNLALRNQGGGFISVSPSVSFVPKQNTLLPAPLGVIQGGS